MSDFWVAFAWSLAISLNVIAWGPSLLRWMDNHEIPVPRFLERCWYAIRDTIDSAGRAVANRVKRVRH